MTKNELAVKKETAIATYSGFEEFAGGGFSEVNTEDLAIPFLRILAQLSPQVNKRDGAYVDGAEAGMVYNTVMNRAFNGEEGILVVPCHYNRRYVEWQPREKGGGYVASYEPEDPIVRTTTKGSKGEDILPNGNLLTPTAQFFVLFLHEEGAQRALITMTSTQLKKARKWLSQMESMKANGKNGLYTLPMFSQIYRLRTVEERNDKGSWFGWEISRERPLNMEESDDSALVKIAVDFARGIRMGEVKVKDSGDTPHQDHDHDSRSNVM